MTRRLLDHLPRVPVAVALEGGYDISSLGKCAAAVMRELLRESFVGGSVEAGDAAQFAAANESQYLRIDRVEPIAEACACFERVINQFGDMPRWREHLRIDPAGVYAVPLEFQRDPQNVHADPQREFRTRPPRK